MVYPYSFPQDTRYLALKIISLEVINSLQLSAHSKVISQQQQQCFIYSKHLKHINMESDKKLQ